MKDNGVSTIVLRGGVNEEFLDQQSSKLQLNTRTTIPWKLSCELGPEKKDREYGYAQFGLTLDTEEDLRIKIRQYSYAGISALITFTALIGIIWCCSGYLRYL